MNILHVINFFPKSWSKVEQKFLKINHKMTNFLLLFTYYVTHSEIYLVFTSTFRSLFTPYPL